jgi:hypothetical protein
MVEVEFNIEANEDTIAAANAAKAKPLNLQVKNVITTDKLYLPSLIPVSFPSPTHLA